MFSFFNANYQFGGDLYSCCRGANETRLTRVRAEFEFCVFEFDSSFIFQARELSSSSRARIRVFEFELSLAELKLDSHH